MSDLKKAFYGANAKRKRANTLKAIQSGIKAYQGKNAERKRRNTAAAIQKAAKTYGPLIGAISGMGDYQVASGERSYRVGRGIESGRMGYAHGSTSHAGTRHHAHPKSSLEKGMMTICHSEYIGDLISSGTTGSSNFVSQSYAINPGNQGTFPWLSSTAINFQHYRFKKLVFEYRPLTSESTSSTAVTLLSMGSVIAATQYNSILGPYTTKQQMAESDFAVTVKPSEHLLHAVECDPKFNPLGELFVSAQTSLTQGANSSDIRMQNLGIFEIASCNVPVAANTAIDLGEIWVHYEVELYKPQINAYLSGLLTAHYFGTVATQAHPLGNAVPVAATNNLLNLIWLSGANVSTTNITGFAFPLQVTSGSYLVVVQWSGLAASTWVFGSITPTNCTLIQCWANDAAQVADAPLQAGAATNQSMVACVVEVNAPGAALASLQFAITTMVNNSTGVDIIVTPYNSNMFT